MKTINVIFFSLGIFGSLCAIAGPNDLVRKINVLVHVPQTRGHNQSYTVVKESPYYVGPELRPTLAGKVLTLIEHKFVRNGDREVQVALVSEVDVKYANGVPASIKGSLPSNIQIPLTTLEEVIPNPSENDPEGKYSVTRQGTVVVPDGQSGVVRVSIEVAEAKFVGERVSPRSEE